MGYHNILQYDVQLRMFSTKKKFVIPAKHCSQIHILIPLKSSLPSYNLSETWIRQKIICPCFKYEFP